MNTYTNELGAIINESLIKFPDSVLKNVFLHFELIGKDPSENYQNFVDISLKFYQKMTGKQHPVAICEDEDDLYCLLSKRAYDTVKQKINSSDNGVILFDNEASNPYDLFIEGVIINDKFKCINYYRARSHEYLESLITDEDYLKLSFDFDYIEKIYRHIKR